MNASLGMGVTGTNGYCLIILPSGLGISKWIMEIFKIFVCTFSAGKQEIQSQQHFVIMLNENVYYHITSQVPPRSTNF